MSHKQSKARRRLFGEGMKQLNRKLDICLWPSGPCDHQAIRAHSIQNKRVLDRISRSGQVVMIQLSVTLNEAPKFEFQEVGRNLASTFTGLCSTHDQELFRPIDTAEFNPTDEQQLFLLAYRSVLKEVHASRKSAIDTQSVYLLGSKHGLYSTDQPSQPGLQAVEQMMSAYLAEHVKEYFAAAYRQRLWGAVSHTYFEIDAGPALAVSSMFTTGIQSKALDGPAFVTLNVFPQSGRTGVLMSVIAEDLPVMNEAFERVLLTSGHFQQYELSKLILRKCENFAISPELFESFDWSQRSTLLKYYERNSVGQSFEMDDPQLFLFAPVPRLRDDA